MLSNPTILIYIWVVLRDFQGGHMVAVDIDGMQQASSLEQTGLACCEQAVGLILVPRDRHF